MLTRPSSNHFTVYKNIESLRYYIPEVNTMLSVNYMSIKNYAEICSYSLHSLK